MTAPSPLRVDESRGTHLTRKELALWKPTEELDPAMTLAARSSARVAYAQSGTPVLRVSITEGHSMIPTWLDSVVTQANQLSKLADNWDTYGGSQPDRATIELALSTLGTVMPLVGLTPELVPTSPGGIDLEWEAGWGYLAIMVRSGTPITVYFANTTTGDQWEAELATKLSDVRAILSQHATNSEPG